MIFACLCLVISSCIELPDNFILPAWDVDLNLPLTNREYTLDEIIKKSKNIRIDSSSSGYEFIISSDTIKKSNSIKDFVTDRLKENYTNQEITVSIGDITVELPLSDGMELDSAGFSAGLIEIAITNKSTQTIRAKVTMPAFLKPDGSRYSVESSLNGGNNIKFNEDLKNHIYSTHNQTNKSVIKLDIKVYQCNPGDKLDISLKIINTQFSYVRGLLRQKNVEPVRNVQAIPLDNKIREMKGKAKITEAVMNIGILYQSDVKQKFDVLLQNVTITGKARDGSVINLKRPDGNSDLGNFTLTNGNFSTKFDNSNSTISEFINFLPDSVVINADASVNPENKPGEARITDMVDFSMIIETKSILSVKDVAMSDTLSFTISEQNIKDIKNGKWAKIDMRLENGIPLSVATTTSFSDSVKNRLFSRQIVSDAATTDGNGRGSLPNITETDFELDSAEIFKLSESKYIIIDYILNSANNGGNVTLSAKDKIRLKSYCKIKYHLEP